MNRNEEEWEPRLTKLEEEETGLRQEMEELTEAQEIQRRDARRYADELIDLESIVRGDAMKRVRITAEQAVESAFQETEREICSVQEALSEQLQRISLEKDAIQYGHKS